MQVIFRDCPPLNIQLDNTDLAKQWKTLLHENYTKNPKAVFRDPARYTLPYLKSLAQQANQKLDWDWNLEDLSLQSTTLMHKDIEQLLSQGYANVSHDVDHLLDEIHFCLHAVENGSKRNSWLQIEWFNNDGFPIPGDQYPGKINLEFGDLRLQNPYVGHHPLYLYTQNDHHNVSQTCRFHDMAKPGLCIVIHSTPPEKFHFVWRDYLAWFKYHAPKFVEQHGTKKLLAYTGHPVIGRITNLKDLELCLQKEYLEFESINFC